MKLFKKTDFLAEIQFIDYWDAKLLLNDKAVDFLGDIQFVDYWDTDFFFNKSNSGVSLNNWNADV